MRRFYVALFVMGSVAYPLLVYAALGQFSPRWIALLLAALAALRAAVVRQPFWWAVTGGALPCWPCRACCPTR
jgi:hypothetical protein